ncbi:hypothetical protein BOTCAL_0185g00130 [Botryotinia calthae]|uniref:Uncharacterized protein n=1 Tax=Botryotinia calthae TaxID=38488 RepID=A0A4Y8D078_9HELO|nr:hypothetical protein BOTCAL_0185g00130 [Botryotinia calthae]
MGNDVQDAILAQCRARGLFPNTPRLSTERRKYGKAKLVDSRRRNVKRSTRKTFASADCNGNDRVDLDEENDDYMSGKDTNTSRDWNKDEIVESLPGAKEFLVRRENSESAHKYLPGEGNTNRSSMETHTNGSPAREIPEAQISIRRYEIFGNSPQTRKAGLVRRVGQIKWA